MIHVAVVVVSLVIAYSPSLSSLRTNSLGKTTRLRGDEPFKFEYLNATLLNALGEYMYDNSHFHHHASHTVCLPSELRGNSIMIPGNDAVVSFEWSCGTRNTLIHKFVEFLFATPSI